MRNVTSVAGIAIVGCLVLGCADGSRPTSPSASPGSASLAVIGGSERVVSMMDACDPTTFNAVIGPGTCTRTGGGVTFDQFITQLGNTGSVGAWRFAPATMNVSVGQTLLAINRGGEAHTFTEVAHFGGGFIPDLNNLSGNPIPAPECLQIPSLVFVPPGGLVREEVHEAGTELYQCCLHPWMRVTVHANHGS
jgi:hypothetical protein